MASKPQRWAPKSPVINGIINSPYINWPKINGFHWGYFTLYLYRGYFTPFTTIGSGNPPCKPYQLISTSDFHWTLILGGRGSWFSWLVDVFCCQTNCLVQPARSTASRRFVGVAWLPRLMVHWWVQNRLLVGTLSRDFMPFSRYNNNENESITPKLLRVQP